MPHFDFQTTTTLIVFAVVILLIAFDVIDMMLAALLGVSTLIVAGVLNSQDVVNINRTAGGPIALLFGGMVVARVLAPTGIFERLGTYYLRATKGNGKRFLLGLIILVQEVVVYLKVFTVDGFLVFCVGDLDDRSLLESSLGEPYPSLVQVLSKRR